MYLYYCIHTKNINVTWETKVIEKYIDETNMFFKESEGNYKGINFFCLIGLMKVKNWDSWNSENYDSQQTNYISIITSQHDNAVIPEQTITIMKKLSELLCEDILLDK
ncbi:hypothetical protein AAK894_09320 [Lachnospiraceae bacterium 46-61]